MKCLTKYLLLMPLLAPVNLRAFSQTETWDPVRQQTMIDGHIAEWNLHHQLTVNLTEASAFEQNQNLKSYEDVAKNRDNMSERYSSVYVLLIALDLTAQSLKLIQQVAVLQKQALLLIKQSPRLALLCSSTEESIATNLNRIKSLINYYLLNPDVDIANGERICILKDCQTELKQMRAKANRLLLRLKMLS